MVREGTCNQSFKNTINNVQAYNIKVWLAKKLPQSSFRQGNMRTYASISISNPRPPSSLLPPRHSSEGTGRNNPKILQNDDDYLDLDEFGIQSSRTMLNIMFPLEVSILSLLAKAAVYLLEAFAIFLMVAVTCFQAIPILTLNPININVKQNRQYKLSMHILLISVLLLARLISTILYILLTTYRTTSHYAVNKLLQTLSLILFRIGTWLDVQQFRGFSYGLAVALPFVFSATTLVQYLGDVVYILSKEQRYGYFDSRLYYVYYLVRIIAKGVCIFIFNIKGQNVSTNAHVDINLLIFLFIGACVQCYCLSRQSFYSSLTRNLLLILWLIVLADAFLAFLIQSTRQFYVLNNKQNNRNAYLQFDVLLYYIILYSISFMILVIAWRSRYHLATFPLSQFNILSSNYQNLQSQSEKVRYIWAAIRLISLGYQNLHLISDAVTEINWAINKYCDDMNCKNHQFTRSLLKSENSREINIIRRKKIGQFRRGLYIDFYQKFVHHCYVTMQKTFKEIQEIKYLLIFFFNEKSAEKMMFYLNRDNFYDIREYQRIKQQHRSSDLAAKINQMQNNEIQINLMVKEYFKKQKKLIELIFDSSTGINLQRCKQVGEQIIKYQQKMLNYGYQNKTNSYQRNRMRVNKKAIKGLYESPKILSQYSRQLLNLICKQMLNVPHLFINNHTENLSEDEYLISQIMNQEQSLVLLSAQPETIGKIVAINPAASKLTYYLQSQLVGQNVNTILPQQIHLAHGNLLKEHAEITKSSDKDYVMKNLVYVVKKNKYCGLCQLSVRFIDGTMGKRWLAKLAEKENFTPFIICDSLNKIIGFNQTANILGINFNWLDVQFKKQFRQIFQAPANQSMQQHATQTFHKIKPIVMSLKEFIEMSNYEQKRNKKSSRNIGGVEQQKKDASKTNIKSLKALQRQKTYIDQQKLNNLLQLSLICQVNKIGNQQILGYYMVKIIVLDHRLHRQLVKINSRRSHKLSQYASHHLNVKKSEQNLYGTQKSNQSVMKVDQAQRKIRKSNSIKLKASDNFTQKNQSSFQFHYYPALNSITNENFQNVYLSQKSINQMVSQSSPIQSQSQSLDIRARLQTSKHRQRRTRFNQNTKEDKIKRIQSQVLQSPQNSDCQQQINNNISNYNTNIKTYKNKIEGAQDINQLIYINGQLQFRQNKKLEQKFQCETHPLHVYHQGRVQMSEQQIRQREIPSKNKIYSIIKYGNPMDQHVQMDNERINMKKDVINQGRRGNPAQQMDEKSVKLSNRHKVLIGILIIFCVLISGVGILGVVQVKEIGALQRKKIQTLLLNGQQIMYYNQLSNNFNNFIVTNLYNLLHTFDNSSYSPNTVNKNIIKWEISQMVGGGASWFGLMKGIQAKNSQLSDIDDLYKQQLHKVYQEYIPRLNTKKDISQLSNTLFLALQQLQEVCKSYGNMSVGAGKTTNSTATQTNRTYSYIKIDQKVLNKSMKIWVSLVSQIIPIKIYVLWQISDKYNTRINNISRILQGCLGILGLITLLLSTLVVCVIRQLRKQYDSNMEIFSFFPLQILQHFMTKLNSLENKINNDQDLNSQVDMQSLGLQENHQLKEDLLFHKKKIQRNNTPINMLPALSFCSYMLIMGIFMYILVHAIVQSNNTSIIENWFYVSSFRVLSSNYEWQHAISRKGLNQLKDIQPVFKNNLIINQISINQLVKDNKQTQRYNNFLKNTKQKLFSNQFIAQVSERIDQKFCQYAINLSGNGTVLRCENFVGGLSIENLEGYLQMKKYSLQILFQLSFKQKNVKIFTTITKFFDNYSRKLNEDRIIEYNREIILKQVQHRQKIIMMDLYIGLVAAVGVMIVFAVGYVWCVYKSKQYIIRPIFILVRCFPLIALNNNESFLEWYHKMKQKQLR